MQKIIPVLFASVLALPVWAQTVDLPAVKAGDRWSYRITEEKGPSGWVQTHNEVIVQRATSSSIYFTAGQVDSKMPAREVFMGTDWSRVRAVNGKEMVVNQPLAFPLLVGKTWTINYTEQHPNKNKRYEQQEMKYTVLGYEQIEVPAGKFKALKIESEGRWTAEIEPNQTVVQTAQVNRDGTTMATQANKTQASLYTGRTYAVFWYVPEVKRWVKSIEESYDSGGVRSSRTTVELEAVKFGE